LNGSDWGLAPISDFNNPNKLSAIYNPGPATRFAFLDERADSIDDGFFGVDMLHSGAQAEVVNIPANYHNGCSSISFADGHAEIHRWMDRRTEPPMVPYTTLGNAVTPGDLDAAWLQEHCTAPQ
jgi:prepilin-type processing-associated H-X9-DG protein